MAKAKKTSADKITLVAQPRTEVGKKTRNLRKEGFVPANVFGKDFKSQTIKVTAKDFSKTYRSVHETGLVYIQLDKEEIPVLVASVQLHPLTDKFLHVDFRKVDLKQKIETVVPIQIVGESEAVKVKNGVLITLNDHLMVEALPTDIPKSIEIDVAKLTEIGQDIKVSDLKASDKYTVKEEPTKIIVSVTAHKEESVTPETQAATPEVITEKPAEEGAAPAEGGAAPAAAPEQKAEKEKAKKD